MKKIFIVLTALVATISFVSAQDVDFGQVFEMLKSQEYRYNPEFAQHFTKGYIASQYSGYSSISSKIFDMTSGWQNQGFDSQKIDEYISHYGFLLYCIQTYKDGVSSQKYVQDAIQDFLDFHQKTIEEFKINSSDSYQALDDIVLPEIIVQRQQEYQARQTQKISEEKALQVTTTQVIQTQTDTNSEELKKIKSLYMPVIKFGTYDVGQYYKYIYKFFEKKKSYYVQHPEKIRSTTYDNLKNFRDDMENKFLKYDDLMNHGLTEQNKAQLTATLDSINNAIRQIQ